VTTTEQTFSQGDGKVALTISFTAIPLPIKYRPERLSVEPLIPGLQLAQMRATSPQRPGQARLWFRWDRSAAAAKAGSAWVAVLPRLAGALAVGDWVQVGFADGDVDLPMVTAVVEPPAPPAPRASP
jgi:uncharacterized protein involved in type VI secretion and phage assembly